MEAKDLEIYKAIKQLYEGENASIVDALFRKGYRTIHTTELKECGFKPEDIVAHWPDGDSPLFDSVGFWEETYYKGYTLFYISKSGGRFEIKENQYSKEQVDLKTKIREVKREINSLDNTAWAYRFDMEMRDLSAAETFEKKLEEEKKKLEELENEFESSIKK
jgi:hypothetical protein